MAGGLIGLVSGGALGFAAGKYREREQQKQQVQQLTLKGYMDDAENSPEVVNNPEWEKAFRKSMGDSDAADAAMMHFKIHAAERSRQQAQAMDLIKGIMGGGAPTPQGAPMPSAPAQATPQGGQGQPAAPATAPTTGAVAAASPTTAAPATDYHAALANLEKGEAALALSPLPDDVKKSMQKVIDGKRKDLTEEMKGGGDKPQKPPGLLEAYSTAFAGKPFNQLDPASQQRVLAQFQSYQNDPKLAAFQRSQDEYDRRFQKQQDARDAADKEKDARSRTAHGNAVRSSVTALQAKAAAQLKMYNAADQTQETRQAGVDILNSEADDLEQQIQDGIADGTLPEDFKAPNIRHYQVDPESGGIMGFFKKAGLAKPAASGDVVKGTATAPASAGNEGEVRRNTKTGEYRTWRGGKWVPSDEKGNPIAG